MPHPTAYGLTTDEFITLIDSHEKAGRKIPDKVKNFVEKNRKIKFDPMPKSGDGSKYDPNISASNAAKRSDLYADIAERELKKGNATSAAKWQALANQANNLAKTNSSSNPTSKISIYSTEQAAAKAAPGAYISDATKEGLGYVPRAEAANASRGKYDVSPRTRQVTEKSKADVAAREAQNSPAHNAAFRAQAFQQQADRAKAKGDTWAANMWNQTASEQRAKAKQLGYNGNFTNVQPYENAKPKPGPPAASSPKPSSTPSSSAKPSGRDWTMNPPTNAAEDAAYRSDMMNAAMASESVKKADDKVTADDIKKNHQLMESDAAKRKSIVDQGKRNAETRDLNDQVKDFREVEQRWRDKAAKATTPEQKEHALQMAAEYADKAKDREKKISDKKNEDLSGIKPLSKADKNKLNGNLPTDPMQELMEGIPAMNNASAYAPAGGTGGRGGATGFFTRDGKVIPITA